MTQYISNSIDISKIQPFVKWVGGKRGLLSQILPLLPKEFNNYFEPFVGGGALFFELQKQGKLDGKKVYLFDINSELINAYNMVKKYPKQLILKLSEFKEKHSKEFYYEVRAWDREKNFLEIDNITRASRFIYLNKTCFNGLYRVNRKNQNNVPMGSYKNPKICDSDVIYSASYALQNATILNASYKEVLEYATKDDLVYFDPPYYPLNPTSSFTSYSEFEFLDREQEELFEVFCELDKRGAFVVHSNSDTEFVNELYNSYNIEKIQANRFINSKGSGRGKISEILVKNYKGRYKMASSESWEAIFDMYGIHTHNFDESPYEITNTQIKEATKHFEKTAQKAVRILCKQDSREDRPKIFIEKGLFLLPKKNGIYYIIKGEGYIDIPPISTEAIEYNSQLDFCLDTSLVGNSEMQHLDFAYASSLIRTFMNDDSLVLTIRGRKYTPEFSFNVNGFIINTKSVQTEVDAGYEGRKQVVLIEAKNSTSANTISRQLFYPYKQWKSYTNKEVKCLFFEKQGNIYNIWDHNKTHDN